MTASFPDGILSSKQISSAIDQGIIHLASPPAEGQIQPASLDLRLGKRVWRIRASFLPGHGVSVAEKLETMAMHEISLEQDAVLEKGCVYIAELEESLDLPHGMTGFANPKSSTGRLDVFTRMIADGAVEFETAGAGYKGPLYAEISPRTFSVLVRRGSRLSQIRFRQGASKVDDADMQRLQDDIGLVHGGGLNGRDIRDGVPLSVDLSGNANPAIPGLVGWRARKHAGMIDVDKPKAYPVAAFWEKVTTADLSGGGLVLNPDEFYILVSRECVTVPADYAAEMSAYDTRVGEFRAHYAGFFDPGFGMADLGAAATRAVLEVRSHDVPFLIEEGQTVCRLVYEPLSEVPETLYGSSGSGSNYQAQGLQLAKHFLPPEGNNT
ncbi:MAG: 2'-deoxycytidine 5'-triphosphate deaminase [Alphaproteobacteria bacterium]|nr:2'-deoxycytidine 5'-triphosphate deaminase [Alphaproteobacteria bacterium]